jgi:hypothetical protein
MLQTIITPEKNNLDISVELPADYVGKPLHVLIFKEYEVKNAIPANSSGKKPSDFFGTLSKEEGEKFMDYVTQSRKEWERGF